MLTRREFTKGAVITLPALALGSAFGSACLSPRTLEEAFLKPNLEKADAGS